MGFFGLGGMEILIILLFIAILFFGAKKIPEFAKALGRAMGEFRRGKMEIEREIQRSGLDRPISEEERQELEAARRLEKSRTETGKRDSRVVQAAVALGIDTRGKTEAELRKEIAEVATKK